MEYPIHRSRACALSIGVAGLVIALLAMRAEAQGQGRANQPPQSPRAAAPFDPTGYWSSLITQNWRLRMVPPAKGDYIGIPISALILDSSQNPLPGVRTVGQGVQHVLAGG